MVKTRYGKVCIGLFVMISINISPLMAQIVSTSFFNVRNFGAVGDGKHLDHVAINKAITKCAERGGGTVIVPSGNYLCGSIRLKSNINLYLDAGAVILGAQPEMNAYDPPEEFPDTAYQDGGHTYFHNSLIWGENLKNISITGRGMINGGGLTSKDKEHLGDPTGGSIGTGDKAIALKLCTNVLIRDISIFHGGHFAILATGCDLITMDNLTIDTNRDGIDIDCCTNAVISNSRVNCPNDDAICPKSSYALNRKQITENLLITNCIVSGFKEGTLLNGTRIPAKAGWSNGRIKFGTESNGGFRNCVVSNCVFKNSNGLALEQVDGGIMDNIIISNVIMTDVSHYPIYITLGKRNRGPKNTTGMGIVKNILISNIRVDNADSLSGIQITGVPGYYVENIQLRDVYINYKGGGNKNDAKRIFPELDGRYPEPFLLGVNPAYGLFVRHVKNLELTNIRFQTLKPDLRPAIICEDVDGLELNYVKVSKASGMDSYVMKNVKNLNIKNFNLQNY
ncbi:glycoside hydrolase family 28 protein [Pedobacter mendelii]|uniref:rhamnogalacturonidase n=1 Tax=Pedobacter mendelii TaxID=1908240 RepID=UPI0036120E1B